MLRERQKNEEATGNFGVGLITSTDGKIIEVVFCGSHIKNHFPSEIAYTKFIPYFRMEDFNLSWTMGGRLDVI